MKRHIPLLFLLVVLLCVECRKITRWIEQFESDNDVLKYWNSDGNVWRVANISDISGINLEVLKGRNILAVELDNNLSQNLYFNKRPGMNTQDAQLFVDFTVLGCNTLVQLYLENRIVLEGAKGDCSDSMWLPLQFSTYLTTFDDFNLMLGLQRKEPGSARPVLFSRLEVTLKATHPNTVAPHPAVTANREFFLTEDPLSAATARLVAWREGVAFLGLFATLHRLTRV